MKTLFGTCVYNPFGDIDTLNEIVDDAKEISIKEFISVCDIEPDLLREMTVMHPDDYRYFRNKDIYFYEWSRIEHFYK